MMRMKKKNKTIYRAASIALSAIILTLSAGSGVRAAAPAVTVDETMYVNLDYYGNLAEVNVVKGCSMNGNTTVTDYGTYTAVENMTNLAKPVIEGDKVTWDLSNETDQLFYFSGKVDPAKTELPWTFDVSYRLNGKERKAQDLAGASGMVTTIIDVKPNPKASDYLRNNMILLVGSYVDQDSDNYSLDAPGAEIQTIGTKKAILFMALPGEEGSFRVDIGTNNYENIGMLMMMMPATLSSLDRISDIREVKDKVRDSLDGMSDSANIIFDNMLGMKSSLEITQEGLRAAKEAKKIYDGRRDQIKNDADAAINSLDGIMNTLTLLSAQTAVEKEDFNSAMDQLDAIRHSVYDLHDYMDDMEDASKDLEDALDDIRHVMKDNVSDSDLSDIQNALAVIYASGSDPEKAAGGVLAKMAATFSKVSKSSIPGVKESESLIHELGNVTNKAKELINETNALGGHMTQDYKEHMMTLIDELQMLLDNTNMTIYATQTSLRSIRELMDATEKSLDKAIDSSLTGMIGVLDGAIGITNGTETFRSAKDTMKNAIEDEIDEIEDETNILNIDTGLDFPSFTSTKNPTPTSMQIILRTEEIRVDDSIDAVIDIEGGSKEETVWDRLKALFMRLFGWLFD
ncbi:MAG: hypothetical protein E7300_07035 [Lachnospiraceae bacterium]|nr:hypothetical protein [Lachnospiraceae bacterium]